MSKLYVFGIGGTGSRVLRSLTMLLASGVNINVSEIVPIIIDPDASNADLTRNVALMDKYVNIHSQVDFTNKKNKFFKTRIAKILQNFTLDIQNTSNKKFKQFIDLALMTNEDKALMQMLFSEKNLEANMQVGFKGNPNIGSVVLNQIVRSKQFEAFANAFAQGDKIFIISSIFGGTGASGFPLLLKTLRTNQSMPNHNVINNAEIGAITILPYFNVTQDDKSEIDSSTFISKTKSALAYYENNVAQSGQVDALYYLGDSVSNMYANNDGGNAQKNDAHIVEFLAATSIVDFCNNQNVIAGGIRSSVHKEFGLSANLNGNASVSFSSFDPSIIDMVRRPLTQFMLMANALYYKRNEINTLEICHSFEDNFLSGNFMTALIDFSREFRNWLEEMQKNTRALDLFNLEEGSKPFDVVKGATVYKVKSPDAWGKSDYNLFFDRINRTKSSLKDNDEDKLLEMFYLATERLSKEKLKF